ncbi:MAG: dTMP kinase [Patescibacteria group bacterium UBA2163]
MKGKFIVLEGGEGAGKSSAISWLKDELSAEHILFTREPGGTFNAEEIREVILKHRDDDLDSLTQILLFEAARREHVLNKVIPALKEGTHVICDRFSASTYAYQIIAGGSDAYKDFFLRVDALAVDGAIPDHTILLDVDPEIGIARRNGAAEDNNVFDDKKLEFHQNVRIGMKEYLAERPHTIIDAGQTQDEVREAVKHVIMKEIQ